MPDCEEQEYQNIMSTYNVVRNYRKPLKHLALALAMGAGLAAGSAQAVTYASWTFSNGNGDDSSGNGRNLGGSGTVVASPSPWGPSSNCVSGLATWPDTSGWGLPTDDFTLGGYFKANHPAYTGGDQSNVLST